jgi:serine/threonine protein kinase
MNYPYDPKNIPSTSSSGTPQNAAGGTEPDLPLLSATPQTPATPSSGPSGTGRDTPSGGAGIDSRRRLLPGIVLSGGRYKIERLVAAGGMGAVYRAIDTRFNRPCAVKEMLDEFKNDAERNQAVEWFGREATLLLDLNHLCIPRVRDFFVEEDKHYLVMDFIEGRTLGEVLERDGTVPGLNGAHGVPEARARSWAQQICSVLSYLHNQQPPIIFRDLKPSNIMVTTRDEIKLIDFGIARTFQGQSQATIIMTVGYAPQEQLLGMPEPRSDIYALGATLHRILTHHDAANNKPGIFSFPPVRALRPDISPGFEQVVMKALALMPDQRWSSAAEMERAIINLPPIMIQPPLAQFPAPQPVPRPNPPTPATPQPVQTTIGVTGPGGTFITAALEHIKAGRIEPAYQAVQQAFALEPNNSLVHRTFGQVFALRKPPQIDQALQAYSRSLQLNPNDPETHKLIGDVWLFLRRQPLQAIPAYTQSLRLKSDDYEAHQRLAQCFEETNQLDPALREYQEAARLAPKLAAVQYALGLLAKRMNQFPVAERAFVEVLRINPADHATRFLLSQVYESENKLEDALRECNYVVTAIPTNQAAQTMLQRVRSRLGR